MKALIFGHSHMWGVRAALAKTERHPNLKLILCGTAEFPGSLVYDDLRTGKRSINPSLLTSLHQAGADPTTDVLVSGVQGNQYNALALLVDAYPFDVHIPGWATTPASDACIVPYRAARAMIADELREFESFCNRLKALSFPAFAHLASPPPIPDEEFIAAKLPALPSGERAQVSPAALRLKLWTMQTEMMKEMVEKYGGIFLPPPPGSRDGGGFLKQEYWKDSVHANSGYHLLQLEQIQALLDHQSGAVGG